MFTKYKKRFVFACAILLVGCEEPAPSQPSAAENVSVIQQTFIIPTLNRARSIRLYLPPDYMESEQRYPVLYMHDGQNLFDDATSYAGEWGVDESLNQLHHKKGLSLIVVGIDNGQEKRMNELSPWPNTDYGPAEGEAYMTFILNVVKPYVDQHYRTQSGAETTAIMGSSMGGLISHYAAFEYPEVFAKVGVFSPSYWFSEEVWEFSEANKIPATSRLYFLMGEEEGNAAVENFEKMVSQLQANGLSAQQQHSRLVKGGEHNEAFWRQEFPIAIEWLFADMLGAMQAIPEQSD